MTGIEAIQHQCAREKFRIGGRLEQLASLEIEHRASAGQRNDLHSQMRTTEPLMRNM